MKKFWRLLFVTCLLFINDAAVPAQKQNHRARLFDSYGALTSEDAGARSDNFAIQLQNEPDVNGYVICYGPEGDGSGTGNYVAQVTKDYFVNIRGIEPERIQTIYGGRYKNPSEIATELWLVPVGAVAPIPKRYKKNLEAVPGKFTEYEAWDGFADDAGGGPSFGNVRLAAFADVLRQQSNTTAYIVAFNLRGATPGTWRRVAKRDVSDLQDYGIQADRIKIIYGGIVKGDDDSQQAKVQLWILPAAAPPPVKEAKSELTPKAAIQIGSYNDYTLKYPKDERWIFEGFADVLRANERLNVCMIVRPRIESGDRELWPDEPPDIDPSKLVEKWKSELLEKYAIKESRIIVIHAAADEVKEGMIEVWVVPPGVALPDPYAAPDDEP